MPCFGGCAMSCTLGAVLPRVPCALHVHDGMPRSPALRHVLGTMLGIVGGHAVAYPELSRATLWESVGVPGGAFKWAADKPGKKVYRPCLRSGGSYAVHADPTIRRSTCDGVT